MLLLACVADERRLVVVGPTKYKAKQTGRDLVGMESSSSAKKVVRMKLSSPAASFFVAPPGKWGELKCTRAEPEPKENQSARGREEALRRRERKKLRFVLRRVKDGVGRETGGQSMSN